MLNKPEYSRNLPHFHHYGATYFVTFRLKNSLPEEFVINRKKQYQEKCQLIRSAAPGQEQRKEIYLLQRAYFQQMDAALDKCQYGPDFLKNPDIARLLIDQLSRFDGLWYRLLAYTIMPNHVHLVQDFSVQQKEDFGYDKATYKNLDYVMQRIKGASARSINLALGRTGNDCWQPEYHDRYIRSHQHLVAAVNYVKQNAVSAGLCSHWLEHQPFTWVHPELV